MTVTAERVGMVIGRRGKIVNELQRRLNDEFTLPSPKLDVVEVETPALNAQVMAEKIASAMERGWYYRRAGHSAAQNIMDAGARGVIITLAGKLTGSRNRTRSSSSATSSTAVRPQSATWTRATRSASRNSAPSV